MYYTICFFEVALVSTGGFFDDKGKKMNLKIKKEELKEGIGAWIAAHTEVAIVSEDTAEVMTTEIDSYGDSIYCFVQEKDGGYVVSDDGNLLFKLDPGATDQELYQTAEDIALGAGFEFDQTHSMIYVQTDKKDVAQAIIKLAQLQLAISYLG